MEASGGSGRTGPDEDGSGPELARRFAAGDPGAVREVYARWAGPVLTVVRSRIDDGRLAEEVVQDTFLRAWRAAGRFDAARPLGPWLYEIARNATTDALRHRARRPVTTALPPGLPDEAGDPGRVDPWEAWQVRLALDRLHDEERELIRLVHYVGLTQSEVAEHLGVPIGTVKSRAHRAHRRLARALAHLRVDAEA